MENLTINKGDVFTSNGPQIAIKTFTVMHHGKTQQGGPLVIGMADTKEIYCLGIDFLLTAFTRSSDKQAPKDSVD